MSWIRARLTYANVVSSLCLFLLLGGGAYAASSSIGGAGTVHGCYRASGSGKGALRLVGTGTRCRKGERSISWSRTGVRGPAGARGPSGAPGKDGATGPAGSADTAAAVLAKLATVDGQGSGLDADTLDGRSSGDFQLRGTLTQCPSGQKVTGIAQGGDVQCADDDRTPAGDAGGDLDGTYPNPTIEAGAVTADKLATPAWQTGAYGYAWGSAAGSTYYAPGALRDVAGTVHLRGRAQPLGNVLGNCANGGGGQGAGVMWVLPAALRPPKTIRVMAEKSGVAVLVQIAPDGALCVPGGASTGEQVSLDGISFRTDA